VIDAWRTSCPRLPVWEDANDERLVARHRSEDGVALVSVSALGRRRLREHHEARAAGI
jgi:D-3-phosphoglycerate dehydrogenase / 2-oxoglutarate reductase